MAEARNIAQAIDYPAILERQRTAVADAVNTMKRAIASRRWLYDGERGSYAYDDDRFYAEFKEAIDEIEAAMGPLMRIARDLTGCPTTQAGVDAARRGDDLVEAMRARCEAIARAYAEYCLRSSPDARSHYDETSWIIRAEDARGIADAIAALKGKD